MKKNKKFIFGLLVFLIIACGSFFVYAKYMPEDRKGFVLRITEMSDLATVEYSLTKTIKANDTTWYKIGDRKILFNSEATVKAGVELGAVKEEDIKINENSIDLILPAAKVITFNMPPEKINLVYEKAGRLRSDFSNEERNKLLIQAENDFYKKIEDIGILKDAEKNATIFLTNWLKLGGFTSINISYKEKEKS